MSAAPELEKVNYREGACEAALYDVEEALEGALGHLEKAEKEDDLVEVYPAKKLVRLAINALRMALYNGGIHDYLVSTED